MSSLRSLVEKFSRFFVMLGCVVMLAMPTQGQNCNPASVFATPTLNSPDGCPLVTSYFRNPQGNAQMVAFADVNGDGKIDMIMAQSGNQWDLAVELGNGDGTFQAPIVTMPVPCCTPDLRGANWVVVGDFNSDGKPD